jgi:hypothetical protein
MKKASIFGLAGLAAVSAILAAVLLYGPQKTADDSPTDDDGITPAGRGISPLGSQQEKLSASGGSSASRAEAGEQLDFNATGIVGLFYESLREPSEDARRRRFLELLEEMRPEDALAIRELFARLSEKGQKYPFEWAAFWRRWGAIDPEGALRYAESEPRHAGDDRLFERLFRGWASADAEGAKTWLQNHGGHPRFEPAFLGFLDGYANENLEKATRLTLDSLTPDDPLLGRSLAQLAEHAFKTRYADGLQAWFRDFVPAERSFADARKEAVEKAYKMLLGVNVDTAVRWVAEQSRDASIPRNFGVLDDAAARLARQNAPAALDLVLSLPPNAAGKTIGLGPVVKEYARQNPAGLEAWLAANTESSVFSEAAATYALSLRETDAAKALNWAGQVRDREMRAALISKLQQPKPVANH